MDIIAAPATPAAPSALAMIRLSGPDCFSVFQKQVRIQTGSGALAPGTAGTDSVNVKPRYAYRGLATTADGEIIDEIMFIRYQQPASYTGEDMVEIMTHGNPVIVNAIMQRLVAEPGVRPARPGEFTERAFLNGKLDITRAEAVNDLITAPGLDAVKAAVASLTGGLARKIEHLMNEVVSIRGELEARLDFPDEEIEPDSLSRIRERLRCLGKETGSLVSAGIRRERTSRGITAAIAGLANAGKSSLLNVLAGEPRALVHAEPGTTRDYIEERVVIRDLPVVLVDTAGIRSDAGVLERQSIDRSREQIKQADIVLHMVDVTLGMTEADCQLAALADGRPWLTVWNKIDLTPGRSAENTSDRTVAISCRTGENIPRLRDMIYRQCLTERVPETAGFVNARQKELLMKIEGEVRETAAVLERADPDSAGLPGEELAADHLRRAAEYLGELSGRDYTEENLSHIFGRFCLGK